MLFARFDTDEALQRDAEGDHDREDRRDEQRRQQHRVPVGVESPQEHVEHHADDDHDLGHDHLSRPPKRRSRCWYSSIASKRFSRRKSGHSTSVKTNSEYAISQSKKLEIRYSPDVRITRSGSGSSGWYRRARSAFSSTLLAGT